MEIKRATASLCYDGKQVDKHSASAAKKKQNHKKNFFLFVLRCFAARVLKQQQCDKATPTLQQLTLLMEMDGVFSPFILSSCTLSSQTSTLLSLVFVSSHTHASCAPSPHHSTPLTIPYTLKFSYLSYQTWIDKWHTDLAGRGMTSCR